MIPKTLAVNAAKDSTDLVAKLRAYHNAAQNAPAGDPKKVLSRYGLDLLNGEVRDNVAAGVLEPAISKVRSLKSAFEAAVSLLRIDDAIQCIPGKSSRSQHRGCSLINALQRRRMSLMGTVTNVDCYRSGRGRLAICYDDAFDVGRLRVRSVIQVT